ncbi:helix-turn-helix transcriptional regulator [Streptomyces sp. NBC_00320]|uniref:TOBE domain-containing protein n=1 Tax=unclassified Streptomyces TaxID=2593676 RepID=UPI000A5F2BB4|nr:helix-turn-helix transcriptional regulator [Streptomyces sp. NBC_00320]MCX5146851.1 helix-turn-helix transcriptional regulator [Streptomyces sp. NBC_00320]WSW60543.1 helix-turn-helix transcriptional regulator [Streptomyces sp. NBC_00998]
MPLYSIGQAAGLLGVSAETVRRWADGGRLPARRAPDGARTVDGVTLAAFAKERAGVPQPQPQAGNGAATSVRNSFVGIVTAVRVDDVAAQVEIQSGPHRVVSVVTRESVEELGIAVGVSVTARVKSTEVYVDLP